jgi:hypothetical protein
MLLLSPLLLPACSHTPDRSRPFFLREQKVETHGRKRVIDRVLEADPGCTEYCLAPDYQQSPPLKIAVLPFADHGNGNYLVNKIPVKRRNEAERAGWSWTYANRLRRAVTGALATREFVVVPLPAVDAVLLEYGITDMDKLGLVSPQMLGRWLGVDTIIYGDLLGYEAYYAFLVAAWKVSAHVRMVSTFDGHDIFSCRHTRYSTAVNPALDPIDMVISSAASLFQLRDMWLARAEYEVGYEIMLRLPPAKKSLLNLRGAAIQQSRE